MPEFSTRSTNRLLTCDVRIQEILSRVIQDVDCTILCGHRSEDEQKTAYESGMSKVRFPDSRHNVLPSKAVDAAPWPIDWDDRERFFFFAGFVMGTAVRLGYSLRWGGDWDADYDFADNSFDDLVHFELRE